MSILIRHLPGTLLPLGPAREVMLTVLDGKQIILFPKGRCCSTFQKCPLYKYPLSKMKTRASVLLTRHANMRDPRGILYQQPIIKRLGSNGHLERARDHWLRDTAGPAREADAYPPTPKSFKLLLDLLRWAHKELKSKDHVDKHGSTLWTQSRVGKVNKCSTSSNPVYGWFLLSLSRLLHAPST